MRLFEVQKPFLHHASTEGTEWEPFGIFVCLFHLPEYYASKLSPFAKISSLVYAPTAFLPTSSGVRVKVIGLQAARAYRLGPRSG